MKNKESLTVTDGGPIVHKQCFDHILGSEDTANTSCKIGSAKGGHSVIFLKEY